MILVGQKEKLPTGMATMSTPITGPPGPAANPAASPDSGPPHPVSLKLKSEEDAPIPSYPDAPLHSPTQACRCLR